MTTALHTGRVEEVQGADGPVLVPERVIQKLWSRLEFAGGARLDDGRAVDVLAPGLWNHGPGPDFRDARLRLDGAACTGDVEVHLVRRDWEAHGHDTDPAYDAVAVHAVLFPGEGAPVRTSTGRAVPELVLLPLLLRSLEEIVSDDALERLAGKDAAGLALAWSPRPRDAVLAEVWQRARERWARKVAVARIRLARLGWEEACHTGALEVLGYRWNRAAMLAAAAALPWRVVRGAPPGVDAWWAAGGSRWVTRGLRPANHPRARLEQLERWLRARPDWPARAAALAGFLHGLRPPAPAALAAARHAFGGQRTRAAWIDGLTGGHVGGTRADNLFADHLLPLLAAAHPASAEGAEAAFLLWWEGDHPEEVGRVIDACRLADAGTPRGNALAQGVLGALLEDAARATGGLAPEDAPGNTPGPP